MLAVTPSLHACPVPVYQYALEHWETDPYEILIHRSGPLTEEQQAALDLLKHAARDSGATANLNLTLVENESTEGSSTPQLEVRYPNSSRIPVPVWKGDLSMDNARVLLASPAREELSEALIDRTSAVWLFLESGDEKSDKELEGVLHRELAKQAREAVVPETAEWGGETVKIDSKVNFKVIRVSREDPAERLLVDMLLASEPDLKTDFADQAMAFPVYGRGILLYALVGRGINERTIASACEFLTGPCSCQIKAGNPGIDLLVSADWESSIESTTPAAVGGATGTGSFLRGLDEAEGTEKPKP